MLRILASCACQLGVGLKISRAEGLVRFCDTEADRNRFTGSLKLRRHHRPGSGSDLAAWHGVEFR